MAIDVKGESRDKMSLVQSGDLWFPMHVGVATSSFLTSSEFRVYVALMSQFPNIWSSTLDLVEQTGLSRPTVVKVLRSLQRLRVISWKAVRFGRKYTIHHPTTWDTAARERDQTVAAKLRERDAARLKKFHDKLHAEAAAESMAPEYDKPPTPSERAAVFTNVLARLDDPTAPAELVMDPEVG